MQQIFIRQGFGEYLKKKVKRKDTFISIGRWSHNYCEGLWKVDESFKTFSKDLGWKLVSPKPELSYEELDKIADRLIAGENVKFF